MMTINEFEKKQILFIFLEQGERISFSNDNIVVKDAQGKIRHQSTCYRIFAVFLIGNFTMTSGILQRSHKFGFPIILMTHGMRPYEVIGDKMEGNVMLRKKQYLYSGLGIASHLILNKLKNQRWALNQQRNKTDATKAAISEIDQYTEAVKNYNGDLQGLIGIEGSAAKVYFKNHFNNIKWDGRKPRVKNDFVNCTLDIGYTLLFSILESMLNIYGFDIYQGVLHRQFYMRKSLVCDVIEPVRPIIDMQIRKSINLGQCRAEDFQQENGRYFLMREKNRDYIDFLIAPILERKRDIFLYIQGYYRKFMKSSAPNKFPVFSMEAIHDPDQL